MLIDSLSIIKGFPNVEVVRNIKFNLRGLNLIVDKPNASGNGIGKTTFLRLIDIAMGASEISALYKDKEQGSENKELKNFIEQNKVYIKLVLFDQKNNAYNKLEVDLFASGEKRINDSRINSNEYNSYLNQMIFNNSNKKPSFRKLIGKFVRIKMDGDNDKFLKFSSPYTKDDEYQNIYDFLFKFQNENISEEILNLKKKMKELEKEFRTIKLNFSYDSVEQINTALTAINNTLDDLKLKQKNYIDNDIVLDEDRIISNRNYYASLNSEIEKLEFEIDIIQNDIKDLEKEEDNIDADTLREFYNEVNEQIDNLSVSFDKLVIFNEKLKNNKLQTNKKILSDKLKDLEKIKIIKGEFYDQNKASMFLIESGTVQDYLDNQSKILEYENKKGKTEEAGRIYTEYESNISITKFQLEKSEASLDENNIEAKINKFNDIFRKFSNRTLGSTYYLYKTTEKFPLKISNTIGPISTGNKKTAIAAFDMAYYQFAKENSIISPGFIVHDVLENIDKTDLDNTLKLAKEIGCQYIIAMLKEKADNQSEISDKDIILYLSEDDKLFKV
ncbi:MAG: DUF2326 domain-containing protein [Tissierellia bacterium]|nr:DUF2326 domain-containing protein [Tissierellia bacterium]